MKYCADDKMFLVSFSTETHVPLPGWLVSPICMFPAVLHTFRNWLWSRGQKPLEESVHHSSTANLIPKASAFPLGS